MTRTAKELWNVGIKLGIITAAIEIEIHRVRAGHWQRSEGAWSWVAIDINTRRELFASQYSATECIKAFREHKLDIYEREFNGIYEIPQLCVENRVVEKVGTR